MVHGVQPGGSPGESGGAKAEVNSIYQDLMGVSQVAFEGKQSQNEEVKNLVESLGVNGLSPQVNDEFKADLTHFMSTNDGDPLEYLQAMGTFLQAVTSYDPALQNASPELKGQLNDAFAMLSADNTSPEAAAVAMAHIQLLTLEPQVSNTKDGMEVWNKANAAFEKLENNPSRDMMGQLASFYNELSKLV